MSLADSTVTGNTAGSDGGGVFVDVTANPNYIFPATKSVTIERSTISGNTATNRGGGVYTRNFEGTETLIQNSRITNNEAQQSGSSGNGGGIYAYLWDNSSGVTKPRFTIAGSTVDNNRAGFHGGGIFVCSKFFGDFLAANSTFSHNQTLNESSGAGGGLFIAHFPAFNESVDAKLHNVTITTNVSTTGGGLHSMDFENVRTQINANPRAPLDEHRHRCR